MKILIAGSSGYIGQIVKERLAPVHEVICLDKRLNDPYQIQADISDKEALKEAMGEICPEVIIHAVGNKDIVACESDPTQAFRINCDTVKNIAEIFGGKSRIIYISTDYVFDGVRGQYAELDPPNPQTIYGKSKLCGETKGIKIASQLFVVLRLSALYDARATFVRYLMEKFAKQELIEAFSDIFYSPTYVDDFLTILEKILSSHIKRGIFHACGETLSRYEFAMIFAKTFDFDVKLIKAKNYIKRDSLFLFPNLSLSNKMTHHILQTKTTRVEDALFKIKQGGLEQ